MDSEFIDHQVHTLFWEHEDNCAVTTLKIASRLFTVPLESQVLDAALGMWGAGGYRAQCGLVEGALMFLGILGKRKGLSREQIYRLCLRYAGEFESAFGSLVCRELRPGGFRPDDSPHLCEELATKAVRFTCRYLSESFGFQPTP